MFFFALFFWKSTHSLKLFWNCNIAKEKKNFMLIIALRICSLKYEDSPWAESNVYTISKSDRTEPKLWFSKMNLDSYCYARTNSLYVKILHYAYTIVSSCLEFWFVTTNLVFSATQNGLDPLRVVPCRHYMVLPPMGPPFSCL